MLEMRRVGERSLQEVIHRIRNSKDAEMALKAAELFRRYRANREQHAPFKCSTSKMIIQVTPPPLPSISSCRLQMLHLQDDHPVPPPPHPHQYLHAFCVLCYLLLCLTICSSPT